MPSQAAPPITRDYLLPLIQRMVELGEETEETALATQWGCYARSSGILNLRAGDIAIPGNIRKAHYKTCIAGINIRCAKTGKNHFTHVADKEIISICMGDNIITYHLQRKNTSGWVFPIKYEHYFSSIKDAAQYFQLSSQIITHSQRIGGALHDFISGKSAESIAVIARWARLSSLNHLFRIGRSWVMNMPTGPRTAARMKCFSEMAKSTLKKCNDFSICVVSRTSRSTRKQVKCLLRSVHWIYEFVFLYFCYEVSIS